MKLIVAIFAFAFFALPTTLLAGEGYGEFTPRDAGDGVLGRMGDLHGTPEERGQRIHEQTVNDHLERVQRNQGDGARLREEQNYRRTHQDK